MNRPIKTDILTVLDEYPSVLKAMEESYISDQTFINTLNEKKSLMELEVERGILSDSMKEEWKTALSNDTKRKAELKDRLVGKEEHGKLVEDIKELSETLKKLEIKIKFYDRTWRSAIALSRIVGEQ